MNLPFRISAMTYTYARYTLESTLASIAEHGLAEVEIWGGHPHAAVELLDSDYLAHLNKLLQRHSLKVSMFTPEQIGAPVAIGSSNQLIRNHSVQHFCRAADAAAAMGTQRMLMTCGTVLADENPKEAWDYAIESLRTIAAHARERDVTLVLEPLAKDESPLLNNRVQLEEAYQLLSDFHPEVMVDLVPMHLNRETLTEYFQVFGSDLSVIHLIDCDGSTFKHLIPGEGVIDFSSIFTTIKNHSFNGSVSLELGSSYHDNPDKALTRSLTFLEEMTSGIR